MRSRKMVVGLSGVALSVALLVTAVPATASGSGAYCGITWGSLLKSSAEMSPAHVVGARIGQHDCWDRLVIDLDGQPAAGYFVRYTDGFRQPGSGNHIPLAGGAVLSIQVLSPAYDDNGNSTVPWSAGTHIATPTNFQTFRDLAYGGTFEGESAFGLGVRARLPFRVFQLAGPGGGSRLVIDVAHRW